MKILDFLLVICVSIAHALWLYYHTKKKWRLLGFKQGFEDGKAQGWQDCYFAQIEKEKARRDKLGRFRKHHVETKLDLMNRLRKSTQFSDAELKRMMKL